MSRRRVSQQSSKSPPMGGGLFYLLSVPPSIEFHEPLQGQGGYGTDTQVFSVLWPIVCLCMNCYPTQMKLSWPSLREALIYGRKDEYLEGSLTIWPFSKTPPLESLLGPRAYCTTDSWSNLLDQTQNPSCRVDLKSKQRVNNPHSHHLCTSGQQCNTFDKVQTSLKDKVPSDLPDPWPVPANSCVPSKPDENMVPLPYTIIPDGFFSPCWLFFLFYFLSVCLLVCHCPSGTLSLLSLLTCMQ